MNVKFSKNISGKIYFDQINGCLLINGRQIKSNSINLNIINNLLNSLSIIVNILDNKGERKRRNIITDKLLLEISKKINEICKNKKAINKNINYNKNIPNENKNENKNDSINTKNKTSILNKLISLLFNTISLIVILLIILFIYDYKATVAKINEPNILEIKEIEKDYRLNKCQEHGHLPLLKPKCESMLNKIEILKNKKPQTLSVISIWFGDIIVTTKSTFGFLNTIIIISSISFIFIIYIIIIKLNLLHL